MSFTTGVAVPMLFGRGLIGVPGRELINGRLAPPHAWRQEQSWALAVSGDLQDDNKTH